MVTRPSVFYQVPGLSTEPPPPLPSNTSTQFTTSTGSSSSSPAVSGTILPKPVAISAAESDKLLVVSSAAALPASTSLAVSTTSNKLSVPALSPNLALLLSFLLSLIPTLAVSLPFFAFRRRRRVPLTFVNGRMFSS